jgi:hypothetical protein
VPAINPSETDGIKKEDKYKRIDIYKNPKVIKGLH